MTPEEYEAAQNAPPEPVEALCLDCMDSGIRIARRDGVRPSQAAQIQPRVLGGRTLDPEFVVINCDRCPADTQRARHLAGVMPPGDQIRSRFRTYEPVTPSQRDALDHAQAWAREGRGFLILVGPVGVGKSHLAKAAALYRAEHGERVVWQTATGILSAIRATFDRGREDGLDSDPARWAARGFWAAVPVLAIDDLGREYGTDWAITEIEEVLTARYENNRPTIITTNLTLGDLAERQGDPYGRLVSRLRDAARTMYVQIEGPDRRAARVSE